MKIVYPIAIIHSNGFTIEIADEQEALAYWNDYNKYPGPSIYKISDVHVSRYHRFDGYLQIVRNDWIARDAFGVIINENNWPSEGRPRRYRMSPNWRFWTEQKRRAEELGIAIPRTRSRRGTSRWRQDKSGGVRECREAIDHIAQLEECGPIGRSVKTGRFRRVIGWWDDYPPRGDQKCWKKQRKTQWKERR